jgi:hypothetical protein
MSSVDGQRIELRHVLDRVEKWLQNTPDLDGADGACTKTEEDVETVRKLRTRVASSLINVAFLGSFSSGKSFLVGGLQGKLEYAPVTDDDGMTSEHYIGLLHSASKATTACPATVVPVDDSVDVDASGRGFLRVCFTDSPRVWEGIGNSPIPAVVAAYTTSDQRAVAEGRPVQHRDRTVAEVEVLLGDPMMPAKLYDLPGTESPHAIHDEIANSAWADADCFLFVTQATRTLSRLDLDLINRLYTHHVNSGKKILWVMTGIDRAAMANYENQPEWKDALEQNNVYLRENFPPPPDGRETFIGLEGFMPVSPAWEAKGIWERDHDNAAPGERLIAASRMARLRQALTDLIEAGTGRRHLVTVATEARTLITPRLRMLSELLESASLPLARLSTEREDLGRRHRQLKEALETVRDQLEGALRDHVRKVERSFRGLGDHLHTELDKQIREGDLTREKEANRIEVRKTQLLQEWVAASGERPQRIWEAEFRYFVEGALTTVRNTLLETAPYDVLGSMAARVDLEQLSIPPSQKYRTATQDLMQKISGFVGLSTPVAAAVIAAAGVTAAPVIAVAGGVTVLAGLVYGGLRRTQRRKTALDVLRQEWIAGLDDAAEQYSQSYVAAAGLRGAEVIDRAVELLSERRDELSRKIILVETRLGEPENADKSVLVAELEPYCRSGEEVLVDLTALAK